MTKIDLVSVHKSISPLDYPNQTPLVSFISLCALHDACLILYLVTLTLIDIDSVISMKSCVYPTPKRGGITSQSETKIMLAYIWD